MNWAFTSSLLPTPTPRYSGGVIPKSVRSSGNSARTRRPKPSRRISAVPSTGCSTPWSRSTAEKAVRPSNASSSASFKWIADNTALSKPLPFPTSRYFSRRCWLRRLMPVSIGARSIEISPMRRAGFGCSRVRVPLREGVVAPKAPPGFKGTRICTSPRSMRQDGAATATLLDARRMSRPDKPSMRRL